MTDTISKAMNRLKRKSDKCVMQDATPLSSLDPYPLFCSSVADSFGANVFFLSVTAGELVTEKE